MPGSVVYAPRGSEAFQCFFRDTLEEVAKETRLVLGDNLVSLVLGGGFGRGEGAVVQRNGRDEAFNDVDLFLFVKDPEAVSARRIAEIERTFTDKLVAHLEFSKPFADSALARVRPALMWFDLLHGHRVIAGMPDIAKLFDPQVAANVPVHEGPRLLLNRGAGLVWAMRVARGLEDAPDRVFVRRNAWKARLALMDAVLVVVTRYRPRLVDKQSAYAEWAKSHLPKSRLLDPDMVGRAVDYKLAPHEDADETYGASLDQLAEDWLKAFLEIEAHRLKRPFTDAQMYAECGLAREPIQSPLDFPRNLVKNVQGGSLSFCSPRAKLYGQMATLLEGSGAAWDRQSKEFLATWKALC